MKKLILGLALAMAMFSCSDDDDDNGVSKSDLIGKWVLVSTETEGSLAGESGSTIEEADADYEEYYVFKDDNTLESHYNYIGDEDDSYDEYGTQSSTGSYELDGSKIVITMDGESYEYDIRIDGNEMTLSIDQEFFGVSFTQIETYQKAN
ncbi:lipocalin family protein [Geofilum sp. OHC36d9]|uniref:lipocalin family protein n=1 Tax=Geofilum sp. OHC36d9 TaxID=3458413 RepID=UPI0040342A63